MITTELFNMNLQDAKNEAKKLADIYEEIYFEFYNKYFDMQLPEIREKWGNYFEMRKQGNVYFDLYLICTDISQCKRRSNKMRIQLFETINKAMDLDLDIM